MAAETVRPSEGEAAHERRRPAGAGTLVGGGRQRGEEKTTTAASKVNVALWWRVAVEAPPEPVEQVAGWRKKKSFYDRSGENRLKR